MRVLVTGATGFIGRSLAERVAARGDRVRALVRDPARAGELAGLGAELAVGSLEDEASLEAAVDGCDLVVHLAGLVKARRSRELYAANADGTRRLAERCARAARPPRVVYVSSLAAAGPSSLHRPRSEDDPPAPVSHYGASKLAGERALRRFAGSVEASVVRPPIVYGRRDRELVPQLVRMARLRLVVRAGFGAKRYSLVHVDDLCEGILQVAARGRRVGDDGTAGVYFLDDGQPRSWDEIARAACATLGVRARVVPLPEVTSFAVAAGATLAAALTGRVAMLSFDKIRELRQPAWTCTSERARAEVGYQPQIGIHQGMLEAIAAHA